MRKALIFLALLLVLSLGGAVYLSEAVYATRDDVTVSVDPYYGDISALEGAEVTLHATYDHRLFWDVFYAFGDESTTATATEYLYTLTKEYEMGEGTFGGLELYPDSHYLLDYNEKELSLSRMKLAKRDGNGTKPRG